MSNCGQSFQLWHGIMNDKTKTVDRSLLKVEHSYSFASTKVHSYKVPLETSVFDKSKLERLSTRSDDSLDSGVSLR